MIKIGPKYGKLKTALHLASQRLRILQAKQLELSERDKVEIAKCLQNGQYMIAKIKAQKGIRQECSVEAMELMEVYCEQILNRYELFQVMKEPDVSLIIPVSSLIWVAPYYQQEVKDLKVVLKQFAIKYGNKFCRTALKNADRMVSQELIDRVRLFLPPEGKTEEFLRKVCRKYNIRVDASLINVGKEVHQVISEEKCKKQSKPDDSLDALVVAAQNGKVDENTEFLDEGAGLISNASSSKKAFTKLMSKIRNRKLVSGLNKENEKNSPSSAVSMESNDRECSNNLQNNIPNNVNEKQTELGDISKGAENFEADNTVKNISLKYKCNECGYENNNIHPPPFHLTLQSLSNIRHPYPEPLSINNSEMLVHFQKEETPGDKNVSSLDEYYSSRYEKFANKHPDPFNIPPQTFNKLSYSFPDPPPPYSLVCQTRGIKECENETVYESFQLPTCPEEIPDDFSSQIEKSETEVCLE